MCSDFLSMEFNGNGTFKPALDNCRIYYTMFWDLLPQNKFWGKK